MYVFKWKEELLYALAVFVVYMAMAYVSTGEQPVTDWSEWIIATVVAASRVAVAALVNPISRWMASRKQDS
ncbi:MAG: hypothetical protein QXP01_01290 [Candidatus Hadarchaeum sp.]